MQGIGGLTKSRTAGDLRSLQIGPERLAIPLVRLGESEQVQHRGKKVNRAHLRSNHFSGMPPTWQLHNEWNEQSRVV